MTQYFGDYAEDETVYIPFNTFDSNDPSASVTITNLADADIMVHKDGGTTQIATDGATVAIDFDGITGNHLITIDTSAHADYSTGSDYLVRIEGTTVDAATINAWVGSFSIENRFMRGTDSAATAAELAKVPKSDSNVTFNATALASINAEADTALADYDGPTNTEMVAAFTEIKGATWASGTDTLEKIQELLQDVDDEVDIIHDTVLSLGLSGSAVGVVAGSVAVTAGSETGTYANTAIADETYHQVTAAGNVIDFYYEFDIGTDGVPVNVTAKGRVDEGAPPSGGDTVLMQAYDWVAAGWDTLGSGDGIYGSNATDDILMTVQLFARHVGTAGDDGKVRIRFYGAAMETGTIVLMDQVYVDYANVINYAGINAECDTALADYDAPTNTEMVARTIPSADYVVVGDTIAGVTLVTTCTTNTDMRGTDSAATEAKQDIIDTNVDAILADTGELQTNQGNWLTATGFSTHSAADVVNEWETQSQADPTGFHVNVLEVAGTSQTANDNGADINTIITTLGTPADTNIATDIANAAADQQATDAVIDQLNLGIIYKQAVTGTLSSTVATTNLTGYDDDQLIGAVIVWTSGDCEGERTRITEYASLNGTMTFTDLTTAPANGDTFKII